VNRIEVILVLGNVTRIALAFEAGRDGFYCRPWQVVEAKQSDRSYAAVSLADRPGRAKFLLVGWITTTSPNSAT